MIYDVTETLIPSHRYHVPRSFLKPNGNTLVLFEECGGDPTQIAFATKQLGSVCAHVSDSHPPQIDLWNQDTASGGKVGPALLLNCPHHNQVISSIKFASYGTPLGTCGNFYRGRCSSNKALSIVKKVFIWTPVPLLICYVSLWFRLTMLGRAHSLLICEYVDWAGENNRKSTNQLIVFKHKQ